MIDQGFLRRECRTEARREQAEQDYNDRYDRIAAQIIAEAIEGGASKHWQPQHHVVHEKVLKEIEAEERNNH